NVKIAQSGGFAATTNWASYLKPDYSLATSAKVFDSTLGDSNATTNYGSMPEYGQAQSSTVDPTGLNLTSTATYETPGGAGYMRLKSTSLAGGATTSYLYYNSTTTKDNPCTTPVEAYRQGGMLYLKTEPDPDGAGPQVGRTVETRYDDA